MNANKNITANFAAVQCTVTFYSQSVKWATIIVNAGSTIGAQLPKSPTRDDWDFNFWQVSGGTTAINANTIINSNLNVNAIWKQIVDGDANSYTTVTIGTLTWLKENLKTTKLNDGKTALTFGTSVTWPNISGAAYCSYNDDSTNKSIYGALYNWAAASNPNIAPIGWHVATKDDWNNLLSNYSNTDALKEAGEAHWTSGNTGTNTSNFTALPGGWLSGGGGYYNLQGTGFWWSSTGNDATTAYGLYIDIYSTAAVMWTVDKTDGYSIRCVRNNP